MKFKHYRRALFRGYVNNKEPKFKEDHVPITLKSGETKVNVRIYDPGLIDQILHKDYLEVSGTLYIKDKLHVYEKQADGYIHAESITRIERFRSGEEIEEDRVLINLNDCWRGKHEVGQEDDSSEAGEND